MFNKQPKKKIFGIVCTGQDASQAAKRRDASFEAIDEPIAVMSAAAAVAVELISATGIREGYYTITNNKRKEIGRGNISGGSFQSITLGKT